MTQSTYPHPIKLIILDIDGTLLNSELELSDRNEQAIKAAMAEGVQVVLATGKTRNAGLRLIERLGLTTPGIYLQGLATHEPDGRVRAQQTLDPAVARQVITFAEDRGFLVIAYSGMRIMVRKADEQFFEATLKYHEPAPEVVGPLQNLLDTVPINKLMAIGDARAITALRWQLNAQLNGTVKLVQANIREMVEILPPGASKGAAAKTLIREMKTAPENVMAMGDGENDIELLQNVGLGITVGNAEPKLKQIARWVIGTNDEDAVAEAIERFVLKRSLTPPVTSGDDSSGDKMIPVPTDPKAIKETAKEAADEAAKEVAKEVSATADAASASSSDSVLSTQYSALSESESAS